MPPRFFVPENAINYQNGADLKENKPKYQNTSNSSNCKHITLNT